MHFLKSRQGFHSYQLTLRCFVGFAMESLPVEKCGSRAHPMAEERHSGNRDVGIDKPNGLTMTSIQTDILDYFPMLADWPSQKVTWADLMFTESEIIIGTMLELMQSYGIPCFSVHDSIIVRKSDQQIAMETLKDQFFRRTNIEPRLKVN